MQGERNRWLCLALGGYSGDGGAVLVAYMRQAVEHLGGVELVQINAVNGLSPIVLHGGNATAMALPSIRLIRAVGTYDPDKGTLKQHIFNQLRYELLDCATAYRMTGMTGTPTGFQGSEIASLDACAFIEYQTEERIAA